MNLHQAPVLLGVVSCLVPLAAVVLRRRGGLLSLATVLTSLTTAFHLFAVWRLLDFEPRSGVGPWVLILAVSPVPLLLAAYLLAVSLGRERPEIAIRRSPRTFIYLGVTGIASLLLVRHPSFVTGYDWEHGMGTIHLGWLGKAYLSYLLVGIVVVGYNLESTYRLAVSGIRHRIRLPMLGKLGILGFYTFVLTTGILYSSLGLGKLVAAGLPVAIANACLGFAFLRGSLIDVAVPVSRQVVYSSFTAVAAALYVLAVGVVAQVATFTRWAPDEVVTLSLGFLAVLVAVLLLFSNRFQRQVRRFIDCNFYVNRYDYRSQWGKVNADLSQSLDQDALLQSAHALLRETFLSDEVTILLRDHSGTTLSPQRGRGVGDANAQLKPGVALYERLRGERRPLLLDRKKDDFEYIPIYAENDAWLGATASQVVAPLLDGEELIGAVGLERSHEDDPFNFEDLNLLESVTSHLSSALRSARLAEDLAESREMELVAHWSSMLLHDLKNYLTPLRLAAKNLVQFKDRPDVIVQSSQDIDTVVTRMQALMQRLSQLRHEPRARKASVDLGMLTQRALEDLTVARNGYKVETDLQPALSVAGDEGMLRRVLDNLLTNAVEAMQNGGVLRVQGALVNGPSSPARVCLTVVDTGCGMPAEFVQNRLFRPFATTKKNGLGLGLYQSRAIIRAHGGDFTIESTPDVGTTARVILPVAAGGPDQGLETKAMAGAST